MSERPDPYDADPPISVEQAKRFLEGLRQPDTLPHLLSVFGRNDRLTQGAMLHFLHSPLNSCIEEGPLPPDYFQHPLKDYFIASSHNTYLVGKQVLDSSSAEAYRSAALSGLRCVEIDTWDSEDGPVVKHGSCFTSKVPFIDVVRALDQCAFEHTHLPLVISIENHCSVSNQHRMADIMTSVFGAKLLSKRLSTAVQDFPSPAQLSGRILVKFKKHGEDEEDEEYGGGTLLRCQQIDVLDEGDWCQCTMVITDRYVIYAVAEDDTCQPSEAAIKEEGLSLLGTLNDILLLDDADADDDGSICFLPIDEAQFEQNELQIVMVDAAGHSVTMRAETMNAVVGLKMLFDSLKHACARLEPRAFSSKLTNLVVYTQSMRFRSFSTTPGGSGVIHSLQESRALKLASKEQEDFVKHTNRSLVRVYPDGKRIKSTNYNPVPAWSVGCQMAALNIQTGDVGMWLNRAMFSQAGGHGFVLKPKSLRDPAHRAETAKSHSREISLRVLSAINLPVMSGKLAVTVCLFFSDSEPREHKMSASSGNCLACVFDETFKFVSLYPDLEFLWYVIAAQPLIVHPMSSFVVTAGKRVCAQGAYVVSTLKHGGPFSLPLFDENNNPLLASLLVAQEAGETSKSVFRRGGVRRNKSNPKSTTSNPKHLDSETHASFMAADHAQEMRRKRKVSNPLKIFLD